MLGEVPLVLLWKVLEHPYLFLNRKGDFLKTSNWLRITREKGVEYQLRRKKSNSHKAPFSLWLVCHRPWLLRLLQMPTPAFPWPTLV